MASASVDKTKLMVHPSRPASEMDEESNWDGASVRSAATFTTGHSWSPSLWGAVNELDKTSNLGGILVTAEESNAANPTRARPDLTQEEIDDVMHEAEHGEDMKLAFVMENDLPNAHIYQRTKMTRQMWIKLMHGTRPSRRPAMAEGGPRNCIET